MDFGEEEKQEEEIHVLLVAFSAQGHLNPMLRFGKRLATKGLQVTLATTEIARERMLNSTNIATDTNSMKVDANTSICLEFFSDGHSLDYNRKTNLDDYMDSLGKFGPINLSNLIDKVSESKGGKFSCVVNNPFVPWVADVAQQHGIPCAMLWIQPCALYAIYYRFYNELNAFPTLTNPEMDVELPGFPLLKTEDLPSFVLPSNPFGSFPKLFAELFKNMGKLKWVLGNSVQGLEEEVIESMLNLYPIHPVGPLVPTMLLGNDQSNDIGVDMWKPDETCIEWLDTKPHSSVVYVSFGSITVLSAKQMENIAMGLKNSNCYFLWVVKPSEYKAEDDSGELPTGFLEEIRESQRGLVVKWCSQTNVLMHPSVGCFITHCGWNSTLEATSAGVPMIGFPQWTDQPTNAKLINDVFKTGLRFKVDEHGMVSKEEVERCISEIMDGPKSGDFKNRVAVLKEATRKAVSEGGSSELNIQGFIDEIKAFKQTELVKTPFNQVAHLQEKLGGLILQTSNANGPETIT
ncbi:hypothetical protein GIB67_021914 [Kingdonia uniflora]|uniref:Glycosyltransferase n=1 Tax=Kingdonia uniflora TaxID=39325 RepID=A0A7J7N4D8_9MAGN|nr:hypothetical protein GIB67_021914 [Kingdonia uniflora]